MNHCLKCWPDEFHPVMIGAVTSQLRRNDRRYRVCDTLTLQEYDPKRKIYTGSTVRVNVTGIITRAPGLHRDFCILSTFLPASATRFIAPLAGRQHSSIKEARAASKRSKGGSK